MHDESDRIFLAFRIAVRLHHVAIHRRLVPALERELLELAEAASLEPIRVDGGQPTQRLGRITRSGLEQVEIRRRVERSPLDHYAVSGRAECRDLTAIQARRALQGGWVDFEQGDLADVIARGEQPSPVKGSAQRRHGAIPVGGQCAHAAIGDTAQHDLKAVGLESGARHGEPGQIAIGEEHRLRIPGRVVGGQVARCARALRRHLVEIEICRPGFTAIGEPRTEHEPRPVRAERIVFVTAEGL